jgi:predicted molibdopterin-dependent oxidoreductase YjgC
MCDEGRFTYKPVNAENRLRHPIVKRDGRSGTMPRDAAIAELKKSLERISGNAILGIGSARFTNEANAAFMGFLRDVLGVKEFAFHAIEVSNPSQDDFLISPDKNPNRAGVEALGFKPLVEDRRYQVFFALGELPFSKIQKIAFEKGRKVVLFATHEVPEIEYADFVFPTAAWAEDEGTWTNRRKITQKIAPAFPPPGESLRVVEWMEALSRAWKTDLPAQASA